MSLPLTPLSRWLSGTNQNSVPANDNSLRVEIALTDGIADDVTTQPAFTSPDDDGKWYVIPNGATGTQWSDFAEDSIAIFYGGTWSEFVPAQGSKISVDGVLMIYDESNGWEPMTVPAAPSVNVQATASTATLTPTFSNDVAEVTAQAEALTIANPTGTPMDGWGIVIRIKDDGTARSLTWDSEYRAIGVTLPATTVLGKQHYVACIYNAAAAEWDVLAVAVEA